MRNVGVALLMIIVFAPGVSGQSAGTFVRVANAAAWLRLSPPKSPSELGEGARNSGAVKANPSETWVVEGWEKDSTGVPLVKDGWTKIRNPATNQVRWVARIYVEAVSVAPASNSWLATGSQLLDLLIKLATLIGLCVSIAYGVRKYQHLTIKVREEQRIASVSEAGRVLAFSRRRNAA